MARAVSMQRSQTILTHQACNPMLAARLAVLTQVLQDPRCAIDAMAGDERGTNQSEKSSVFMGSARDWLPKPCVVPRASDTEDPAHGRHVEFVTVQFNELVRLPFLA